MNAKLNWWDPNVAVKSAYLLTIFNNILTWEQYSAFHPKQRGKIPLPPVLPLMQMDDLDHPLFGLENLLVHLTHSMANGYGRQLQDGGG